MGLVVVVLMSNGGDGAQRFDTGRAGGAFTDVTGAIPGRDHDRRSGVGRVPLPGSWGVDLGRALTGRG